MAGRSKTIYFLKLAQGDAEYGAGDDWDGITRVLIDDMDRKEFPGEIPSDATHVDVIEEDNGIVRLEWVTI
jgi:hypothetical protein